MSKKALQLGFCVLVLAALAVFDAPAIQAAGFDFSYSQTATGSSWAEACSKAVQKIKNYCDSYGPITTDRHPPIPIYGPGLTIIDYVYPCTATATYCQIFKPLS